MNKKDKKQLLNSIKKDALKGSETINNQAYSEYLQFIKLPKSAYDLPPEEYYEVVQQMSDKDAKLAQTLETIQLGSMIAQCLTEKRQPHPTDVADIEQRITEMKKENIIDDDAAAYAHYNIALIYKNIIPYSQEAEENKNHPARKHFRKAFHLTKDPSLIKLLSDQPKELIKIEPEILRKAYSEALNNPNCSDLFEMYYGLGKTYSEDEHNSKIGIKSHNDNYEIALFYFEESLNHAADKADKQKALHEILKVQSKVAPEKCFATHMQIIDLERYVDKVKSLIKLSQEKDLTPEQQKESLWEASKTLAQPDNSPNAYKKCLWNKINKYITPLLTKEESKQFKILSNKVNKALEQTPINTKAPQGKSFSPKKDLSR